MKKYLCLICLCALALPCSAGQSALEQAQIAAEKGSAATRSTSANKQKGSAADAFRDNGTDTCMCKAAGKKAFSCDCSHPLAIKGKESSSFKAAQQDILEPSDIKPADLIDQSSTASHINPEEWQERNPQHVEKNNPFDVLKEKKTKAPSADEEFENILSSPSAPYKAVTSAQTADGDNDQVTRYAADNEETLLSRAAENKKKAREAPDKSVGSGDAELGVDFLGLTTAAAAGSLDVVGAISAVAGASASGGSGGGLTRQACNSDRATCMKCCAVECPSAHCAYHQNSKWRDASGMIIRCGCE